jgi:hypothetical protein
VILIHGECGSGKSAALHALESAPPLGWRAVYVPVPTLDFAGLARWCLDRLGADPAESAATTLRELVADTRLLLLVDDADRLPIEAALALRQLEREAKGNVRVVAACASDVRDTPAIAALGPLTRELTLRAGDAEAAAAQVAAALGPARAALERAPSEGPRPVGSTPRAMARALPEAQPAEPTGRPAGPAPRAEPPRPHATGPAAAPPRAPAGPRSVPLSLAITMSVTAFLLPVAFVAGYSLGARPRAQLEARRAEAEPLLPPVSTPPPMPAIAAAATPALRAAERLAPQAAREVVARVPMLREAAPPAPGASPAQPAAPQTRAPQPAPSVAARAVESQREAEAPRVAPSPAPAPEPARAPVDSGWGSAPALISVEPGSGGP